jgi:uncharacterized protein (TIGR02001 family)
MAQKLQNVTEKILTTLEPPDMKRAILAAAAALATALPAVSYAQLAFNVGAVTDYRYRGISQTRLKPAVQGGIDFAAGAFYVGAWASSIKWLDDWNADASVEVDFYGGFKGEVVSGLTFDVGVLTYQYPGNSYEPDANTTELYGALTFGPATLKYSHAVTDTFGNADSKNSFYVDLSAGFDVYQGLMLTPHVGYQKIKGPFEDDASYTDYALTLSKDFSGLVVSAAVIGTDADKAFYVPGPEANSTKFLGKSTLVLGVKYNF